MRYRTLTHFMTPGILGTLVLPGTIIELPDTFVPGAELELVADDTPLTAPNRSVWEPSPVEPGGQVA